MAKEIAISKRLKISEAQEYMLLAVLVSAVFLGVAISLTSHFVQQISFNIQVIEGEEQSIAKYSNVIEKVGICTKPKGSIYSNEELANCNPDSIDIFQIPGTLRANILENLASNQALNSVEKDNTSTCINPSTGKSYTYDQLKENYDKASGSVAKNSAVQLIKTCSALRIIPDALPAYKNEEALLASLNKLFIVSGWQPESLSPSDSTETKENGINSISVSLSVETNTATTMKVLDNIEKSIRQFDINSASIEWSSNDTLSLQAQATAYYMDASSITETKTTIKPKGVK